MAYVDPLESANEELRRADEYLCTFEGDTGRYINSEAVTVSKVEPAPRVHVFSLQLNEEPIEGLRIVAGNAVQSMRTALDQMFTAWVHRVVRPRGPGLQDDEQTFKFPIVFNGDDLQATKKGFDPNGTQDWAFIERVQPDLGETALGVLKHVSIDGGCPLTLHTLPDRRRLVPDPGAFATVCWNPHALVDGAEIVRVTFIVTSPKMGVQLQDPGIAFVLQPVGGDPVVRTVGGKEMWENAAYTLRYILGVIEVVRGDFAQRLH